MKLPRLLFVLPSTVVQAFVISPPAASHILVVPTALTTATSTSTRIYAEGGAPQYEKYSATLSESTRLANYSYLLHITSNDELPIQYEPGHVLALEIGAGEKNDSLFENPFERTEKSQKDIDKNDGFMRGPYTVTRASSHSFDIMVKVVGEKSHRFALASPRTNVLFGGKFKVPIAEGIKDGVKRVVLVSTGVGVGPCVGAIERLLDDDANIMDLQLLACYREEGDVVYADHLDDLKANHPRFNWKAIVSQESGRLSASEENLQALVSSNGTSLLEETHYHLIGNGGMVNEFKSGLEKAGVPKEQITLEMYFNHRAEVDIEAVDRIASIVSASHAQTLAAANT